MDQQFSEDRLRLIAQACDGALTAAERGQLELLLLEDDAARTQYANFCQMEADLHFRARANRAGRKALEGLWPTSRRNRRPVKWILLPGVIAASLAAVLLLWLEVPLPQHARKPNQNETVRGDNSQLVETGLPKTRP